MADQKNKIATNRDEKGFFVQAIDISSIPTRSENEIERYHQFFEAIEEYKKSFDNNTKQQQQKREQLVV